MQRTQQGQSIIQHAALSTSKHWQTSANLSHIHKKVTKVLTHHAQPAGGASEHEQHLAMIATSHVGKHRNSILWHYHTLTQCVCLHNIAAHGLWLFGGFCGSPFASVGGFCGSRWWLWHIGDCCSLVLLLQQVNKLCIILP